MRCGQGNLCSFIYQPLRGQLLPLGRGPGVGATRKGQRRRGLAPAVSLGASLVSLVQAQAPGGLFIITELSGKLLAGTTQQPGMSQHSLLVNSAHPGQAASLVSRWGSCPEALYQAPSRTFCLYLSPLPPGGSWHHGQRGQLLGVAGPGTVQYPPPQGGREQVEGGNDTRCLGGWCASFAASVNAVESLLFPDWGRNRCSSWERHPDLTRRPNAPTAPTARGASSQGTCMPPT